jgi:hypothetical protein
MAWRDGVLNAMFAYIFVQLGCVRCTSIVKKSNKRARAILEGLGFVLEGRIRRGFDGVRDGLVYGMLREECEYIQEVGGGESVPAPEDFEEDEPVEPEHVGAVETQPATGEFW